MGIVVLLNDGFRLCLHLSGNYMDMLALRFVIGQNSKQP